MSLGAACALRRVRSGSWRGQGPAAGKLGVRGEIDVEGDFAQSYNYTQVFEEAKLAQDKGTTVQQLLPQGLVGRRRAAQGRRNVHVLEGQAIVPVQRGGLIGKAELVQGPVDPISAAVAGEHASVRFPPWAAGARPTTSTRASGSPKPGRGRPQ